MAVPADRMRARLRDTLGNNPDIPMAIAVIGTLVVLIVPLHPMVLDILLTVNISLSVVVLLSSLYLQRAADFSIFPSLLLILTLFRLSLNLASTRLILQDASAGNVINAFGSYVTYGNLFVGVVIFIILVVIQFVVITKGATRISEVAARFTLDAMPGKQMGVDSDLNAGLITEDEARRRRREIEKEADFYGAMDGATKFVRGDAVAGIIITIVNIVMGLIIGTTMHQYTIPEAAQVFTMLTIGDGLVSQIPSVIVSTAAGLVVTRTASEETSLGADFSRQMTSNPRALGVAGLTIALIGVAPGMPTLAFMLVGLTLGATAYGSQRMLDRQAEQALEEEAMAREEELGAEEERTEDLLTVDPLKIELGYGLITLADQQQGGDLLSRIHIIRQQTASKLGFIVPVIRIIDNMRLRPNEYQVKMRESTIASYELMPNHFLAMNPGLVEEEIEGIPTEEPAFGLQAMWVAKENRDRAERLGYTIVEPSAVLATHLTEVIYAHADELLTREDVQILVNHLKETAPVVVEELLPNILTNGELQKVLHSLLRERVSIRNLEAIMEVLCDFGTRTKDIEVLTEYVRHAMAREISGGYADEDHMLHVVTVAPALEQEILDAVAASETGDYIPVAPDRANEITQAAAEALQPLVASGQEAIVITSAPARRFFRRIIERQIPKVVVLSYNEIDPAISIESMGQITVQ